MNDPLILLALALIGSVAGLIGGAVFLFKKTWASTLCKYAIPFAAGVLLAVSILHLIPEAAEEIGERGYLYVLLAFLGAFIFEKYFATLHHHEDRRHTMTKATIPLVLTGDTIHNFIDGVAIAAAYLTEPMFGVVVALATFLHETPHEIGDFGVMVSRGWSRKKTFIANFLSALATIPGAFMVYFLIPEDSHETTAVFLAIAAGIFLYLGASDFLPEVGEEEENKSDVFKQVLLVILGVGIMYLLTLITPEH